jgi:hypothetical protein
MGDSRVSAVDVVPGDASSSDGSSDGGDAPGEVSGQEEEEAGWGAAAPDAIKEKDVPSRRSRSLTYQDSAVDRHTVVNAFRSKLSMLDQPLSSVSEREAPEPVMPGASSNSCNF